MRFLFRFLALICLAIAVIAAVTDASRSLAASSLTLTSLGKGWADLAPQSLSSAQAAIQAHLPAMMFDPVLIVLLSIPAAAVFSVLAAIFYAIGAKRARPFGSISMR